MPPTASSTTRAQHEGCAGGTAAASAAAGLACSAASSGRAAEAPHVVMMGGAPLLGRPVPLLLRVPCGDEQAPCASDPRSVPISIWSAADSFSAYEKERADLVTLARERERLGRENRLLHEEVGMARREARLQLAQQRAETIAMKVEQDELQRFAEELQRLVKTKEGLSSRPSLADASGAELEARRKTEAMLCEEHASVSRRVQSCANFQRPVRTAPGAVLMQPVTPVKVTPRLELMEQARHAAGTASRQPILRRPHSSAGGARITPASCSAAALLHLKTPPGCERSSSKTQPFSNLGAKKTPQHQHH